MQQSQNFAGQEDGSDGGAQHQQMEDMTRLTDKKQMANFLTYGKWDLNDASIEKLIKDDERKERLVREIIDAKVQKWSIPPKKMSLQLGELQGKEGSFKGYKLMTSVSIPVYNKKNHTTIEVLGLKPNEIANPFGQVRIAELLGVAGTDVPIAEIEKLIPPYKLGVNGYSFAVNNNGYILYHPDLRPMFQEILKPNYNSVDLAEVELVHNDKHDEPRYNDSGLYMMRKEMVDQKDGLARLTVKVHMDDMKRVTVREQEYFYYNISNTPFTLGIVMPTKYGKYRVSGGLELNQNRHIDANKIFPDDKWKLHPDWVYCEYNYAGTDDRKFDSPERNMKHFLERLADEKASFNWGQSRVRPLPKCQGNGYYQADCPKSAGIPTAGKKFSLLRQGTRSSSCFGWRSYKSIH